MTKNPVQAVQPDKLKKVKTYLEVEERIQVFKMEHYEVFQEMAHLLQERNDALEDAEKEVRARGVNCGPFIVCGEIVKIDVEKLYDELGEEHFLEAGGSMETKRVLGIDKRKFEALVDSGSIPKEVVETCFTRTNKYKAPSKTELP